MTLRKLIRKTFIKSHIQLTTTPTNHCYKSHQTMVAHHISLALSLFIITLFTSIHGLHVPRVTGKELAASKLLRSGSKPFILTDSMTQWESLTKFNKLEWFSENFPDAIVDYYPHNLAVTSKKPFLRKMSSVLNEFIVPNPKPKGGWSQNGRSEKARYIHWRMTAGQWNKVAELLTPMHDFFTTDKAWMKQCIPKKIRNPKNKRQINWPMNNWIRHAHWKIIVIGEEDSSMFFHADGFSTSTFVFQFVGRKRWTLCKPDPEMKHMSNAGVIDTFGSQEHLDQFPRYKNADCKQFDVHPGEVIYYPSHYWHQTLNLDRPCISMAGRRVDGNNAHEVYGELQHRCKYPGPDITKQWPGAAPNLSKRMCKNIGKCYEIWKDTMFDGEFGAEVKEEM